MRIKKTLIQAARDSNRSILSLVIEAMKLRYSVGGIGLSEYLDFRLYLDDLTFAEKTAFWGWRGQTILEEILIDDYARFLSLDKITMYALLRGYGLPIPEVRAVYRSQRPQSLLSIASPEALAHYFRDSTHLPVYLKPSFGSYGRGNTLVSRLEQDMVILGDASSVPLDNFCRSLDNGRPLGWILQEPLVPHAQIALACGEKISGVRIHTSLTPHGPEIVKAIFKINIGLEDSDNFQHGASGNMLAALDVNSGKVTRVVSGTGLEQKINPSHPKTGQALVGFQLPYWTEIKSVVYEAQLAFPGFLCPGWDIAICNDGPKILEVNSFGDIDLSQHVYRRGFVDEPFKALLSERGLLGLLTTANKPTEKCTRNNRLGRRKSHWWW
jgi:Sugar-transfer associated ATP-grasp